MSHRAIGWFEFYQIDIIAKCNFLLVERIIGPFVCNCGTTVDLSNWITPNS